MKFRRIALQLTLLALPCVASAGVVTWGSASLSDNNGGDFLTGAVTTASGNIFTFSLPAFAQSGFAAFQGEVDLGISPGWVGMSFDRAIFTFLGDFRDPGSAGYSYSAGAVLGSIATNTLGSFSETLNFGPNGSGVDLLASAILNDQGGLAGVTAIQIELVPGVPEPASVYLLFGGIGVLAWRGVRRGAVPVNR